MTNYANRPSQASQRYVKNRAGDKVLNHAFRGKKPVRPTGSPSLRPRLESRSVPEITHRHGSPNIGLPPGEYVFGQIPSSVAEQNVDDGFSVASKDDTGVTAGVTPPGAGTFGCTRPDGENTLLKSDGNSPIGVSPVAKGCAGARVKLSRGGRIAVNGSVVTVYDHEDRIALEADMSP